MLEHMNHATMLLVHLAAAFACLYLWRRAPDHVQLGILAVIFVGMGVQVFSSFLQLYGVGENGTVLVVFGMEFHKVWPVRLIASSIEHLAVLLYLVRQVWLTTGICAVLKPRDAAHVR